MAIRQAAQYSSSMVPRHGPRKASRCGYARRTTACQRRKSFARSTRATWRKRRTKRLSSERRGVEVALTVRPPARPPPRPPTNRILEADFEHPIRVPVAPGSVLDDDLKPRNKGRILCGKCVNRADVPVLVEQAPNVATDIGGPPLSWRRRSIRRRRAAAFGRPRRRPTIAFDSRRRTEVEQANAIQTPHR